MGEKVDWPVAIATFMICTGVIGFIGFAIIAALNQNAWYLLGVIPACACVGIAVGIMAKTI